MSCIFLVLILYIINDYFGGSPLKNSGEPRLKDLNNTVKYNLHLHNMFYYVTCMNYVWIDLLCILRPNRYRLRDVKTKEVRNSGQLNIFN